MCPDMCVYMCIAIVHRPPEEEKELNGVVYTAS